MRFGGSEGDPVLATSDAPVVTTGVVVAPTVVVFPRVLVGPAVGTGLNSPAVTLTIPTSVHSHTAYDCVPTTLMSACGVQISAVQLEEVESQK